MAGISIDLLPPDVRAYWNAVEFQKRVYARLDQLDVPALVRRIEGTGPHDRDLAELRTIWDELVELVKRDIEQPPPWTPSKWVMARVEWIRRFAVEKAGLDLRPPQQEQTPEVGAETAPPIPPPPPPETPPPRIHKIEVEAETALPEPEPTVAPAAAASPEPPPSPAPIQQTATSTDNRTVEELKRRTRETIDRLGLPWGIGKIGARELNIEPRTAQRYVQKIKNDMSQTKTTPRQTASKAKKSKAKRGATPRRKRH